MRCPSNEELSAMTYEEFVKAMIEIKELENQRNGDE